MRWNRRTMIACTVAVALCSLGMVPFLEARNTGRAGAAKDKAKAGAVFGQRRRTKCRGQGGDAGHS